MNQVQGSAVRVIYYLTWALLYSLWIDGHVWEFPQRGELLFKKEETLIKVQWQSYFRFP